MNDQAAQSIAFYGLATVRVAGILTPIWAFGFRLVPFPALAVLSLVIAMATSRPTSGTDLPPIGAFDWIGLAISQGVIGGAIGFGSLLVFEAVRGGAHLLGLQSGGALGAVVDQGFEAPGIERFFALLAGVILFTTDGHHWIVAGIQRSFVLFPLGSADPLLVIAERLLEAATVYWTVALQVALPGIAALLLADLVLGALARTVPLLAGLALSLQLRPAVAIGALAVTLPVIGSSIGLALRNGIGQAFAVVR